jgi:hypothetical protein
MASTRCSFDMNSQNLRQGTRNFPRKLNNAVNAVMDRTATMGEQQMKENAPWHDDTGNARAGLNTLPVLHDQKHKEIIFAHSVEYGIWLETIESGQWAIILKTMRISGAEMMNQLRFLLDRTRF